jgi:hypothetical protein
VMTRLMLSDFARFDRSIAISFAFGSFLFLDLSQLHKSTLLRVISNAQLSFGAETQGRYHQRLDSPKSLVRPRD